MCSLPMRQAINTQHATSMTTTGWQAGSQAGICLQVNSEVSTQIGLMHVVGPVWGASLAWCLAGIGGVRGGVSELQQLSRHERICMRQPPWVWRMEYGVGVG